MVTLAKLFLRVFLNKKEKLPSIKSDLFTLYKLAGSTLSIVNEQVNKNLPVMIVPIRNENGFEEWAAIELHGDLKKIESESVEKNYIGQMFFTKSGTPILIIGIHVLHGKETKMDKPFAVMERRRAIDQDTGVIQKTEYYIKAIIRKKLVFKSRPKPIIYNVQKSV